MVWIQIRTDVPSFLIWVQTVCKGYQQTTKVAASKDRIKGIFYCMTSGQNFFTLEPTYRKVVLIILTYHVWIQKVLLDAVQLWRVYFLHFLAHLSRRLMGEQIVYQSLRRPSVNIFKHLLLWNHWANWTQISYGDPLGSGNESLFKWFWSHDQDGRHAHIR